MGERLPSVMRRPLQELLKLQLQSEAINPRHLTCVAMQVMQKAPLTEPKQIEHVLNERRLLAAAQNRFCVRLEHAFQDQKYLYLLQEWIQGDKNLLAITQADLLQCIALPTISCFSVKFPSTEPVKFSTDTLGWLEKFVKKSRIEWKYALSVIQAGFVRCHPTSVEI